MINETMVTGDTNSIAILADQVKRHADVLASFATREGLYPSLGVNGDSLRIASTESVIMQAKASLLGAMKELESVVKGPLGILMGIGAHEILCLQAISRFQIAQAMGVNEEIPFEELSTRCGLNVKDLQRILRYAMTNFIFCEPRPGVVAHTSVSQLLAQDHSMQDFIGNVCEMRFPASARAVDALEKFGFSQHPAESGFSLSRNTDRGLYDELARSPQEARRWGGAMSALAQQIDIQWVLASFLQATTVDDSPLIVDVGGGRGDISLGLAEHLPKASFVVQDFSTTALRQGEQRSAGLGGRIKYQVYDLRDEQPCANADIYYFRNIFHNWPDAFCIKALRNQIPALKPGAQLLIDDFTLHEPGSLPWLEERKRRWMDINMLVFFGSRERSLADWRDLLASADPRFELTGVDSAPNQPNTILRVQWKL